MKVRELFNTLLSAYGPQNWWPAETRYEVIVGAVLTQNTAWRNVERAIERLKGEGVLNPEGILETPLERLEELIRPAGYYKRKARVLKEVTELIVGEGGVERFFKGETEELRKKLLEIKGVGKETADSILLYAGEKRIFVVDKYTVRIFNRTGVYRGRDYEGIRKIVEEEIRDVGELKEFHALLVEHGKRHCRKRPVCEGCPVKGCPKLLEQDL